MNEREGKRKTNVTAIRVMAASHLPAETPQPPAPPPPRSVDSAFAEWTTAARVCCLLMRQRLWRSARWLHYAAKPIGALVCVYCVLMILAYGVLGYTDEQIWMLFVGPVSLSLLIISYLLFCHLCPCLLAQMLPDPRADTRPALSVPARPPVGRGTYTARTDGAAGCKPPSRRWLTAEVVDASLDRASDRGLWLVTMPQSIVCVVTGPSLTPPPAEVVSQVV